MKLKLFISYSHQDENIKKGFVKHLSPLKDKGLIEDWYDRKILAGEDLQSKINNNLEEADIICLCISANFLHSNECKKEKDNSFRLKNEKGITIIPIILSPCGWQDDVDISKLLALPTDGIAVSTYSNQDEAWLDVYEGLKKVLNKELKIRQLEVGDEFQNFLQETQMLSKSHSKKETVLLDDIFVFPDLDKFDENREFEKSLNLKELLQNINIFKKIVIAGEDLSGKTTICKIIFKELRRKFFIPVYIFDKNRFEGKIENKVLYALKDQYKNFDIEDFQIYKEKIVPIIDDFHKAKNKEKHIEYLIRNYNSCILIVDDVFSLNLKDEILINSFNYYRIEELKASLRYNLIKKWHTLSDKQDDIDYKNIDQKIELINQILGKNIGKGILPSFPFYILSAIVTYETFALPLDQEISSQGYCYQAFIVYYLMKKGVKNDEIDIYINFLTEFANYLYQNKINELSQDLFYSFIDSYSNKYNLPIKQEILIINLEQIILVDSFNNYSFRYPYLYYFFVAKYLVEHIEQKEIKKEIDNIINNLHVDENAYISIFMTHHSRNLNILDEIELNALTLFDNYSVATIDKKEVDFFDGQIEKIIKLSLSPRLTSPENVRKEILNKQDEFEINQQNKAIKKDEDENEYDPLEKDLRRAIRTVEVIGYVMKNRAGSIEINKLEEMFLEAMKVHLRVLSSFFELIKNEKGQQEIVSFLLKMIKKIIDKKTTKKEEINIQDLEKYARQFFWKSNFFVVYGVINKIVHSLGSDKLIKIVNKVCDEMNTPASFLVKHGILMWYNKNLQIDKYAKKLEDKEFSLLGKDILKLMIIQYCSVQHLNFKDRQRIEQLFNFSPGRLLLKNKNTL